MSLFELIGALAAAVAVFGYINHRFVHLADTVGITAIGLLVSLGLAILGRDVPGATGWASSVADRLDLHEVVFHGLLSFLLFAGGLHINVSDLAKQRVPIVLLATIGVALSTLIVGFGTHWLLAACGVPIALDYCLLFGALISPTDPIAVLGVLKTAGAPRALETKIAGESLFNDGTGVVAFLLLLGIVTGTSEPTVSSVVVLLAREVLGALVVGVVVGYLGFFMLKGVDSFTVEILITLALASGGYSLAERLHVSAPLAVVVMGLVIGNDGARHAMSDTTREHLFAFWELLDQILNLVLFGLIGIKMLAFRDEDVSWMAAMAVVPVVLLARLASVAIPVLGLRRWLTPSPWSVTILTWAGLRGGISVALALSLPSFAGKEMLVASTYSVVLFSLLVQATSLGPLLARLGLGTAATSRPADPSGTDRADLEPVRISSNDLRIP